MNTKEIALITTTAAAWASIQLVLGPYIGRISIGPISFHGAVNRLVGWFLMTTMSFIVTRFGRITSMTLIAALITRIIRLRLIEGLLVGLGYILAGLTFDLLINVKGSRTTLYYIVVAVTSGFVVLIPWWMWRIYILTPMGFLLLFPYYAYSLIKGLVLSVLGTSLALASMPVLKKTLPKM